MIKVIFPEYISLNDWAAALVVNYSEENLPILYDEEKWQEWGAIVTSTGAFARASLPTPVTVQQGTKKINFENWQEWAKIVYTLMANERT
jgi:hypothetical protein